MDIIIVTTLFQSTHNKLLLHERVITQHCSVGDNSFVAPGASFLSYIFCYQWDYALWWNWRQFFSLTVKGQLCWPAQGATAAGVISVMSGISMQESLQLLRYGHINLTKSIEKSITGVTRRRSCSKTCAPHSRRPDTLQTTPIITVSANLRSIFILVGH